MMMMMMMMMMITTTMTMIMMRMITMMTMVMLEKKKQKKTKNQKRSQPLTAMNAYKHRLLQGIPNTERKLHRSSSPRRRCVAIPTT